MKSLYTSYFATHRNAPGGYAISLTTPHGFDGGKILLLAPNTTLLWRFKNGKISEKEFEDEYVKHLESLDLDRIVNLIPENSTLLCWEGKDKFCHRHILARIINERGYAHVEER